MKDAPMFHNYSALALLAFIATACAPSPYYAASAPSMQCTPQNIQKARYVIVNMARVPLGGHKIQVVGTLGNPSKVESFMLQDGNMLEVMFYRTGEPGCLGMPTEDRFTPFVFQNGVLLGYGNDYYRAFVLPNISTQNSGMSGSPMSGAPTQQHIHGSVGTGQPLWR